MSHAEILKVQCLTVRFGGLNAVDSVDFSLLDNEIVSLIGPNGAGKTTTFNAITGFVKKEAGTIEFKGNHLEHLRPHEIAEKGIVRTFQITSLFPNLSVLDNIWVGRHMQEKGSLFDTLFNTRRKQRKEDTSFKKALEILKFIALDRVRNTIAFSLPYGDQRVLEIGVALAAEPEVLLLDEPSAGLNDAETQVMMSLIKKLRDQGMTILLVEHDMKLVMGISDRIMVLNFGKKITEGTPAEIRSDPEVIAAYLGERR